MQWASQFIKDKSIEEISVDIKNLDASMTDLRNKGNKTTTNLQTGFVMGSGGIGQTSGTFIRDSPSKEQFEKNYEFAK